MTGSVRYDELWEENVALKRRVAELERLLGADKSFKATVSALQADSALAAHQCPPR